MAFLAINPTTKISIHALLAESDLEIPTRHRRTGGISIHALLAESDNIFAVRPYDAPIFLSTLSLRRATVWSPQARTRKRDFYPRSPCGERQTSLVVIGTNCIISIHALLAESDGRHQKQDGIFGISIHALLAESDRNWTHWPTKRHLFLSTLSLRRATICGQQAAVVVYISIHALLAESDQPTPTRNDKHNMISIHALLAESDSKSAQNSGALLRI